MNHKALIKTKELIQKYKIFTLQIAGIMLVIILILFTIWLSLTNISINDNYQLSKEQANNQFSMIKELNNEITRLKSEGEELDNPVSFPNQESITATERKTYYLINLPENDYINSGIKSILIQNEKYKTITRLDFEKAFNVVLNKGRKEYELSPKKNIIFFGLDHQNIGMCIGAQNVNPPLIDREACKNKIDDDYSSVGGLWKYDIEADKITRVMLPADFNNEPDFNIFANFDNATENQNGTYLIRFRYFISGYERIKDFQLDPRKNIFKEQEIKL